MTETDTMEMTLPKHLKPLTKIIYQGMQWLDTVLPYPVIYLYNSRLKNGNDYM